MMMHPDIQRKAQAEIDKVIGDDRLPTLADQANLPYVDAIAKEVLRWAPVTPIGKHNAPQAMGSTPLFSRVTNCEGSC